MMGVISRTSVWVRSASADEDGLYMRKARLVKLESEAHALATFHMLLVLGDGREG